MKLHYTITANQKRDGSYVALELDNPLNSHHSKSGYKAVMAVYLEVLNNIRHHEFYEKKTATIKPRIFHTHNGTTVQIGVTLA